MARMTGGEAIVDACSARHRYRVRAAWGAAYGLFDAFARASNRFG